MNNVAQFKVPLLCQPYLLVMFSFLFPCPNSSVGCCLVCHKYQRDPRDRHPPSGLTAIISFHDTFANIFPNFH